MITTHVLDLARGVPGAGITVTLEHLQPDGEWSAVGRGTTDQNGRLGTLTAQAVVPGTYRLTFDVGRYQRQHGLEAPFFPYAQITFDVRDEGEHCHVPLLLSPFGYSTYRGS
jgi:5-hydroxyisourate hydrolase